MCSAKHFLEQHLPAMVASEFAPAAMDRVVSESGGSEREGTRGYLDLMGRLHYSIGAELVSDIIMDPEKLQLMLSGENPRDVVFMRNESLPRE